MNFTFISWDVLGHDHQGYKTEHLRNCMCDLKGEMNPVKVSVFSWYRPVQSLWALGRNKLPCVWLQSFTAYRFQIQQKNTCFFRLCAFTCLPWYHTRIESGGCCFRQCVLASCTVAHLKTFYTTLFLLVALSKRHGGACHPSLLPAWRSVQHSGREGVECV